MCLFRKEKKQVKEFDHKFSVGQFVDFWHRDDVYFGTVSKVSLDPQNRVIYNIDIAGQCPETFKEILEEKVIRIHKQ